MSPFKMVLYFMEAVPFYIFYGFFLSMPCSWASAIGGKGLRFLGPLLPFNKRALKNLRKAFPDKSKTEIFKITQDMWENLGRTVAEFPHIHTLVKDPKNLEISGIEHVDVLINDNLPGLFFAAHLANWEISQLVAMHRGISICLIYRAANNPLVNFLIQWTRSKAPRLFYVPKGSTGARESLQALKNGGHVGLLADQKMNDGIIIPFFGYPAMTAPAIAQLARKFKAPIVAAQVIRLKGTRFKIIYESPFFVEETSDSSKDIEKTMIKINEILERWIRENPGQWLWLHNRWPSDLVQNRVI